MLLLEHVKKLLISFIFSVSLFSISYLYKRTYICIYMRVLYNTHATCIYIPSGHVLNLHNLDIRRTDAGALLGIVATAIDTQQTALM